MKALHCGSLVTTEFWPFVLLEWLNSVWIFKHVYPFPCCLFVQCVANDISNGTVQLWMQDERFAGYLGAVIVMQCIKVMVLIWGAFFPSLKLGAESRWYQLWDSCLGWMLFSQCLNKYTDFMQGSECLSFNTNEYIKLHPRISPLGSLFCKLYQWFIIVLHHWSHLWQG